MKRINKQNNEKEKLYFINENLELNQSFFVLENQNRYTHTHTHKNTIELSSFFYNRKITIWKIHI